MVFAEIKKEPDSTAASLRLLADAIDNDTALDFAVIIQRGDGFVKAHKAINDINGLNTTIDMLKRDVLDEV